MVKKHIVFIVLLMQGFCLFATEQMPDILIYNGKEYALTVNPMETYFYRFPEKRPRPSVWSSGLWRGYIATFEIIQNELWLIDIKIYGSESIDGKFTSRYVSIIDDFLEGQEKMKIDWFNGLLVLPQGKIVNYVHMGYGSTYEYYKLIIIENGNYINEFELNHEQYIRYRNLQFEMYKKTEDYEKKFNKLNDGKTSEEMIDYFLKIYEIEYITNYINE
jgi:hypothetical protein